MKKTIFSLILAMSLCMTSYSQMTPQFSFYSQSDYSWLLEDGDNDYLDYLRIRIALLFDDEIASKDKLALLYRMYEIRKTCRIVYATTDDEPLNLMTVDDSSSFGKIQVDFGAALENNKGLGGEFWLWFDSPVTKIDPTLFSCSVEGVLLPASDNLEYRASSSSCVRNLFYLEGRDVIDNELLVSREGELIVAAVADREYYVLPKQITRIGAGAFRGCTLKEIYIPSSVKYIGDKAFDLCDKLTSVTITSPEPIQISPTAFSDAKGMKYKIYVPKSCVKSYRSAYPQLKKRIKEWKVR